MRIRYNLREILQEIVIDEEFEKMTQRKLTQEGIQRLINSKEKIKLKKGD
jgi:flagellar biosynthesis/type III secretory pathway chaperone